MTELLVALVLAGCVDDPRDPTITPVEPIETATEVPLCERVIETAGPCALACDPEALNELIPPGRCLLFVCTLDDGSTASLGGCRPPEPPLGGVHR